jgi:membrane-associated phospholipid phosphatase
VTNWLKLRGFEWLLLGFFYYAALIAPFFHREAHLVSRTGVLASSATVLFLILSRLGQKWRIPIAVVREWIAIFLTYAAFRAMGWFATPNYNVRLESEWLQLDQLVLGRWHGQAIVHSLGPLVPSYFELCYLLVYGVAAYGLALIYITRFRQQRRDQAGTFLTLYLAGTLAAYSLFPYFPSRPPRFAFPQSYPPLPSALHALNTQLLAAGTIHSGVFPSAHVSSAMSAVWAIFLLFPERRYYAWIGLFYAASVAAATVYCRYHYTADVLAGVLISLIPGTIALIMHRRQYLVAI